MQIDSLGVNLHEMSKPVSGKNTGKEQYFKMLSAKFFTQYAKH